MEAKKNKKQLQREKVQDNLAATREKILENAKTRTFPKGHPMNPTKEQRQQLIKQSDKKLNPTNII